MSLGAGTYALAIVNDSGSNPSWYGSGKYVGSGGNMVQKFEAGSWESFDTQQVAFQLTSAEEDVPSVPEPGVAVLFVPVLATLVVLRRRP